MHERFGLDLVDFHRDWGDPHRLSWSKLASLVDILEVRGNSYLTWARSRDVEVYHAATTAGLLRTTKHRPQAFDMDEQTQILAAMFQLMQQHIHVSSGSRKKSKAKPWPTPETAAELLQRAAAEQGYEDLMAEIVFMPQDEFDAHIEAHRDDAPAISRVAGEDVEATADPSDSLQESDRAWLDAHSPGWDQPAQ